MSDKRWLNEAIRKIEADFNRPAETPIMLQVDLPAGSHHQRLTRSLILYALFNGWIDAGSTIIEASSCHTAVAGAYFAQLLGLPFIAVVATGTPPDKLRQIESYGGRCHVVTAGVEPANECRRLARETGGYFLDHVTFAERATDQFDTPSVPAAASLEEHVC